MRLVLVRHGETEHNRGGLTLGSFDAPLNDRGRAMAAAVAASFRRAPAALYASPLSRARDTAESIGAHTGVAVVIEPALVEMNVGEMEHLAPAELRARYPEFLRQWLSADAGDARMPGGETLREVQDRAWAAVERMRALHPEGEVVAVTHNFVILVLMCRALELPLAGFRRLKQDLAARSILEVREGGAVLLQMNDRAHLLTAGLVEDL
jgi:broad specificity phosphatase PhoE